MVRLACMPFGPVRQPKLGFGRILVMGLVDGGCMMARDMMACLRVRMQSGGKKRGRGDQQNMSHFTLHSSYGEWSLWRRTAFEPRGKKIGNRRYL